jgi:GTP-binding protein HflX
LGKNEVYDVRPKKERAILVSVRRKNQNREMAVEYFNELESLVETAGAEVIENFYQELERPSTATAIGKGKVEEIRLVVEKEDIQLVVFDDDLTPIQVRNLEKELKIKVMDRSGLILDIFAKHAKTNEAITQVELAQFQYMLPRLTRMWTHLSKQFGGIGTKGPGETQIESDRRMLKVRISKLKEKLIEISTQKEVQRKTREDFPKFSLIGYTNVGKSTLMNAISQSDVYVENKLFATLDTTVRAFLLPSGQKSLISDTVGFIRKLPHHLIASFRSTLAEVRESDIIMHVIDVSHKYYKDQIKIVNETLEYLEITEKPIIHIFNKIDMLEDKEGLQSILDDYPNSIFISAARNINIQALLELLQEVYDKNCTYYEYLLKYENMHLMNKLYNNTDVIEREDRDDGIYFKFKAREDKLQMIKEFIS